MGGRPKGQPNYKNYRWSVVLANDDGTFTEGKYSSIREMNDDLGTKWNCDFVNRLWSKKGVDVDGKLNENAFINKYAHIKLEKICEPRNLKN